MAVHHHLIRTKQRTMVGLLVECGDAREVHHMALLVGYGAGAINPYLAFESVEDLIAEDLHGLGVIDLYRRRAIIKACGKGVPKAMSKMGVSTVASYTGARPVWSPTWSRSPAAGRGQGEPTWRLPGGAGRHPGLGRGAGAPAR